MGDGTYLNRAAILDLLATDQPYRGVVADYILEHRLCPGVQETEGAVDAAGSVIAEIGWPGPDENVAEWGERVAGAIAAAGLLLSPLRDRVAELEAEVDRLGRLATVEGARESKRYWKRRARAERRRRKLAESTLRRVAAFSLELRGYCSPHGVATTYADRLDGVLDGVDPVERLREKLMASETRPLPVGDSFEESGR